MSFFLFSVVLATPLSPCDGSDCGDIRRSAEPRLTPNTASSKYSIIKREAEDRIRRSPVSANINQVIKRSPGHSPQGLRG